MHETGLMQRTLDMAAEYARKEGYDRITSITVVVGAMSGVVPEALNFAFEALSPQTLAADGRLMIEKRPAVCYCRSCKQEFKMHEHGYTCPECDGVSIEMKSGDEFELKSLEVE